MSEHSKRIKSSYSSVYKIYRRFRFLRYKRKVIRQKMLEIKRAEASEQAEVKRKLTEFRKEERLQQYLKRKADREEARKYNAELAAEFRERRKQSDVEFKSLLKEDREKARTKRIQEYKERRRLFKDIFKSFFNSLLFSYQLLSPENIRCTINAFRQRAPERKLFTIISFNSTVLFLLSYFGLFLLHQASTVLAASFFDYPTIVYYYEIYYNISPESWNHDSVKTIFSAGPLINLVTGIVFLIIYNNLKETTGHFKIFFLWGFLHAINMLFGAMLVGTLFETGVGHVISWMYVMDTGRMFYSIVSIFILIVAGLLVTKSFLFSGNTYFNKIDRQNRTLFVYAQVFIPYFLGNAALIIIRQPRFILYDTFVALTLIISILPVIATYRTYYDLYFEEDAKVHSIAWLHLAMLCFIILFFRGVLGIGLRFGS